MVRGNHEFTAKDKTTGAGMTYTQPQTPSLLKAYSEPDIMRPVNDPEACYYYFDDPESRLRYCVFDTTDSIASPTLPWTTLTHVSQKQLDWMDQFALHNVPFGYQLVIISHIGIIPETYVPHSPYEKLEQLIQHAGAPVLMVIAGHRHQDYQTYKQGVLHLLTSSDALYPDIRNSPFLHGITRSRNTSSAPLMDLISFSADRLTIYAMRIGAGYSRTFHLDAIHLGLSATLPFPYLSSFGCNEDVTWTAYDATGYECIDGVWDPPCTILSVTADGRLQPLQTGEAVLMATNNQGQKEFFSVVID